MKNLCLNRILAQLICCQSCGDMWRYSRIPWSCSTCKGGLVPKHYVDADGTALSLECGDYLEETRWLKAGN